MKHTHLLLMFVCLLTTPVIHAQQDNNWHFGRMAGLNFTTGRPVAITNSAMTTMEGSASISDEGGNLLFYTNGIDVWNKTNHKMPHGTGLLGDQSTTQGAVIVPKPGSSTHYYIFAADKEGGANGLTYSEVDMAADGGKGDIIAANIQLVTPVSEKITAIYNANGKDIWVTTHQWGGDSFYSYNVTAQGVNTTPVVSHTGLVIEGASDSGHYAGWMTFSPNGKRLASASGLLAIELFDFNTATGVVSNGQTLKSPAKCYGVAFSANSQMLYVTSDNTIFQYNTTSPDVAATQTAVASVDVASSIKLAPDSKIYVVSQYLTSSMSVINSPDKAGTACNFQSGTIDLGGKQTFVGLPNFLVTPYYLLDIKAIEDCADTQVAFEADGTLPSESVVWDFGDGNHSDGVNTVHTYEVTGNYIVKAVAKSNKSTRYFTKSITIVTAPVAYKPQDMATCGSPQATAQFNLAGQDADILGSQPATLFTVSYYATAQDAASGTNALPLYYTNTTATQTIYARVSRNGADCYAVTSFTITAAPSPELTMEDSFSFCEDSYVVIEAPQGYDAYVWLYNDKVVANSYRISASKAGEYTLRVTKNNNGLFCNVTKTIYVHESAKPVIKNVEVTDMSEDNNYIEVVTVEEGNYEYSIDGSNWQDSPRFDNLKSGEYTVLVNDKNGCGMAEGEALILMYPKYFTPNGDGHHDKWQIENAWKDMNMNVTIFDRYGKIMAAFTGNSSGWDGTYNGAQLPSTDYWFVIDRGNGKQYKGHFSMMR